MTGPDERDEDGRKVTHLDGSLPAPRLLLRALLTLAAAVTILDLGQAIGSVDPDAAGRAMVGVLVVVAFAHRW